MKKYDLIVIGAGSGLDVAASATGKGYTVAIVEKGPMGGTCLNRGCIPSKMLIHSADVAQIIDNAKKFGITPHGYKVDWQGIVERVSNAVDADSTEILESIKSDGNTTLYNLEGKFVGERTVQVGDETISAERILIAAGARPSVPDIDGLGEVDFMTSKEALRQTTQPKHLLLLGGGYISCELAHFYGSLGTEITILQRNVRLLPGEDHELADIFTKLYKKRFNVHTGFAAKKVFKDGEIIHIAAESKDGEQLQVNGDQLLVATGRVPNTDTLNVVAAGVETNELGYVKTNEYMQTSAENVWALGDIAGNFLFKHSANQEARYVGYNLFNDRPLAVDYHAMPHAVFGYPQIAGVGYTEEQLKKEGIEYSTGRCEFMQTGMGAALMDEDGLVKVMATSEGEILGCHIIGHDASTLIHEPILAMKAGLKVDDIQNMVHIHPALSEVIERAFGDVGI